MREPAIVTSVLGADYTRLGQEVADRHLHRTLSAIRSLDIRSGVALSLATPLACVRHVLDRVDVLLVMTVTPGFGGQAYLETMEPKVAEARRLLGGAGLPVMIEVDSGISAATAPGAVRAGAELLVAGSAILGHPRGRSAAVAEFRRAIETEATGVGGNPDKAG